MKKNQLTNQYKTTPSGQLVIVLSNTKYTYANFTEFHEVVLNLLDENDLSHLTRTQREHTLFFINMVLGLLESPKKPAALQTVKSGYQKLPALHHSTPKNQTSSLTSNLPLNHDPASKENLQKLLNWIDRIVLLKRITVEKLLDEFYSLGIVELKMS